MKKIFIFLLASIMFIMLGCQGKGVTRVENPAGSIQSASSSDTGTGTKDTASNEDNKKTEGTASSQNNSSTNNKAGSTPGSGDNKAQTTSTQSSAKPRSELKKPDPGSFTLLISRNNGSEEILRKIVQIENNKSLLEYLRDNATVEDEGGFIKSIEGLEAITSLKLSSEQKSAGIMGVDWFIFQNNIKTKSGANDIIPKNGDIINLDYKEWTYKDLAP